MLDSTGPKENYDLPQQLTIHTQISRVSDLWSGSSPRGNDQDDPSESKKKGSASSPLFDCILPITYTRYVGSSPSPLPLVVSNSSPTLSIVNKTFNGGLPMLCRRCARNGDRRYGGTLGVCKIHAKSKCRYFGCKARSLGEELCSAHAHDVDQARWKARAEFRVIDPGTDLDQIELRKEKLQRAKFLAHESVEVFFQSLLQVSQALYGDLDENDERKAA